MSKWVVKAVIVWVICLTLIQIGILHGRKVERAEWQARRQIEVEVSREYQTLVVLERIIKAESGGRHEEVWGQDGEFGIVQFKKGSFAFLAEKAGMPELKWKSQIDQIILCNWAIRQGFGNHWTTYSKAKEGN